MATSTITNTITGPTGTPLAGIPVTVHLNPRGSFRAIDGTELSATAKTTTNASGVWSLALERTADVTPVGSFYMVTEEVPRSLGGARTYAFQVGSTASTLLASLVSPLSSPDPTMFLTQAAADARYELTGTSFGAGITTVTPGDAASGGVAASTARSDHRHAHALHKFQVCTSSTRPSAPTKGDMIYETDTGNELVYYGVTTGWRPPWNMAWGQLGYSQITANTAGVTTSYADSGLTVTGVMFLNRRYRSTVKCEALCSVADGAFVFPLTDAANTQLDRITEPGAGYTAGSGTVGLTYCETGTGVSVTRKLRYAKAVGTGTVLVGAGTSFPAFLLIEDIGPAIGSSPPAA